MRESPSGSDDDARSRGSGERPADPDLPAIRRVLAGEPAAFGELVARHEQALRRLVTGIVADRHLAQDVVQDTMLIAYRKLAEFRGDSTFGTWVRRIAVREAIRTQNRTRRLWRRFVPLDSIDEAGSPPGSVPGEVVADLEEILAILGRLSTRERAALVLYVVEGRSYAEVASILEAPIGTVGSLISRARLRLRELHPGREGR